MRIREGVCSNVSLVLRGVSLDAGRDRFVALDGISMAGASAPSIVQHGLALVLEGRRIVTDLAGEENLRAGGFACRDRAALNAGLERAYALFPQITERRKQWAGALSGGEQ